MTINITNGVLWQLSIVPSLISYYFTSRVTIHFGIDALLIELHKLLIKEHFVYWSAEPIVAS